MVSKNNFKNKMEQTAARTPHYGIRKLSVGVASVLISTTLYMGATTAKADTLPSTATDAATTKPETASSSSSTQDNTTVDKTVETTTGVANDSTDTSVSTTPNAQVSTTNTTAGATSSDKSGANNNSLVTNNVESTTNTTTQTQPKPDVVTSDKANVDNQVGSNVENKATTTTGTISAPTTPKRVVRSLAAAPTANSKELVENQDYTVSNVSLEDHKKQDNFDEDATFLHADIKAKNGDVIANKEITVTFNKKEFGEFWNFKNQDLIYNDQVIGNLIGDARGKKFKIAFNDKTKGFKDINLSLKVYLSDNPYTMRDFYTNNPAKNNEKYTVRYNYQIGSTNYYVDREATIHYVAEEQPTTQTTEQFNKPISFWYAPQEWIQLDITYFTTRDGKTYAQIGGIPGKEIGYDLGLGKGFITPDTKSVTISFEPSSKYYSRDANILKISDNATFDEKTVTHRTQYDSNDLVAGFTDVYTTRPKDINEVSNKHTYYVKDLIKLDGNTLIATDATTSTGLNNLSARGGAGNNGYVGSNDVNYTIVSSDDLRKFVIDNAAKIIETRGEFLTSNSDYSNPGRIVAHNNTTGQDVYYELHNKVRVNNRDVTTPPDGAILVSAGKDIPTKIYSYTSTDIPSNVDKSKLTKEVTRTINVHNPNGTVDTTVQKVTYHQTVTVAGDEVVYNNDWKTADDTNWSEFDVPQIANYKASKDKVYGQWIGGVNTQNQTVDITYTATQVKETVNGSWTIKYTDKMTGEEIMPATTIHTQFTRTNTPATNTYGDWTYVPSSFSQTGTHINFTGDSKKLDNFDNGNFDNFTFNLGLPAAPNSNYNQAYSNFAITFQLRNNSDQPDTMEKTSSVPYDKVSIKQESQTRTLTEHYVYADGDKKGQKIADDAVVEIFYSREVKSINDQVVSTSEWKLDTTKGDNATPGYHVVSGTWTNLPTTWSVVSVSAPTIQGYTTDTNETENNPGHVSSLRWVYPTQSGELNDTFMPGNKHTYEYQPEHTTYYHANNQSIKINYVDDEKGGATVKSDTLNGKTDETVKTGITIPENYSVVGTTPSEYTFKANGNTDITVHLKHVIDTTSEEKTVTRTIKVTDPTGKVTTIPQTTKVTRSVSTDKVTNQKTYGDWTTSSFDAYTVPTIDGYTASQDKVDAVTVDGNTTDQTVNISYTADEVKEQTTFKHTFHYIDKYTGEKIIPDTVITVTYERTNIPGENKYGDWTIVPDSVTQTGTKVNATFTKTGSNTTVSGQNVDVYKLQFDYPPMPKNGNVTYSLIYGSTGISDIIYRDANKQAPTLDNEFQVKYNHVMNTSIKFVDDDFEGRDVDYRGGISGEVGEKYKLTDLPENYELANGQADTITFATDTPEQITVHLKHKVVTKQLKLNADLDLTRLVKYSYGDDEVNYLPWINNDELDFTYHYYNGKPVRVGSVTGSVQYDLVFKSVVKANGGETLKFGKTLLNYPSDDDVANGGALIGYEDLENHTFTDILNKETHENLNYKMYASANLTKDLFTNKKLFGPGTSGLVTFTFENGKQYGSDHEIDISTIDNSFSINFNDLVKSEFGIDENDDGSLSATAHLHMPIAYQPYISKTVTRTINVTNPDGTIKTIKQTAEINQNVGKDVNSNHYVYLHKGDVYVTDNNWSTYTVPTIDGYTATQPQVDKVAVNGDTTDQTIDISYTANKQSVNINYVDINDDNKVVHVTTVDGVTDGDATVTNELPAGYKLVDGQSVPKTIHFNANNDDINVKVQHSTVTVTPDSPKTPNDKLPDNPGKSYPSGVAKDDLVKTVTRKVVIVAPDGKETVTNQTVTFTRNATVDEVTGNVTYGSWSENGKHEFVTVNVPTVAGYTADGDVPSLNVTPDSKDTTVTINYTANEQSTQIVFVDKDGKTVDKVTVNGKTGDTVETNAKVPDGWKLTGNEVVPSQVTFTGEGVPDKKVTVDHATVTVTPDSPKTPSDKLPDNPGKSYPSGVAENDLNKDVTRTIKVTDPTGKATTETQTVHLTRSATVDEVTGDITYGDWSTGSFDGYDVPTIEGYTATQSNVDTATVTSDTQNSEVNISYTANPQSIKINYVDDDKGGATVKSDALNGKTDETVKTGITIPENYTVVGTTLSEYTFKANGNTDITVHLKHVIDTKSEEKTITRTIKVTNPNGGVMTIPQSAKSTRTVSTDKVTGEVTYGDWSKATLEGYDVPEIEGYTASQPSVDQTTVDGNVLDSEVNITYTANKQVISIDYVDNGKVISTQVLTGKTDETVKTNIQSPDKDKYVLVGTNPESYTFKAKDNADVRVEVKHVINDSTESKDVTRTIVVTSPDGKETTKVQKATVSRTVHTDAVTGDKTYDEWSKATLDKYNVPTVDGYTPSLNVVEGLEVDGNNEDSVVKVGYTANPQSIKVNYVDEDNGSSTVKTETLNGKTDQTVKTGIEIPDGYVVEGQVPTDYTFKAKDNADITVKLKHGTTTVTADNPKTTDDKLPDNPSKSYPSGVGQNDLNKDVTRTIKVTDPKGKVTTTTQTVHLTRTATVDEVTGKVSYGDWTTGSFDSYVVPSVEGYTASQAKVDEAKVTADSKNSEVNITYTANNQSAKIVYVDRDNGDSIVKTDTLNGKTDQTVKTGIETPDGYVVEGQVPTDYTFKAKDNADITVHLTHNKATVTPDKPKTTADKLPNNPTKSYPDGVGQNDLNKTVTRTIKVTTPDGKTSTTTQTVYLTRTATVDEVTGKVTYSDWTTGSFDSYDVPSVDGYTASQSKVDGTPVTADSSNNEVNISYTANDQSAKIVYVDNGKVVSTQVLTGKTDQTVKTNIQSPDKDKYVVVGNNPENYTFKAKDNEDIKVEVKHVVNTFKDYKNVIRSIEVTYPNGKTEKLAQVATLERTVHKDAVTGEETYSDWSNGGWDSFKAPEIKGYTADKDVKETVVTGDTTETTVSIVYTANEQATKIVYVDNDKSGSIVKTDTLNGKTDQTVKTDVKVPDGYVLEGSVPDNYTFTAGDNFDIIVHLKHGIVKVTPDKPKTTADKLPDSSKTYPKGVGQDDLNKTITRTIKVTTPDDKTSTTTQTVHLIRTARVDETTGQVTYDDWTTGSFDSYDVPSVDGYTASQAKVEETKVTSDSQDSEVNISYTANKQSIKVVYVDGYNSGSTVKTDTLTGKTDETVKTGIEIPDGYEVDGQVPSEYSFKAKDNADITVHLKHSTVTVIPDLPKTTDDKLPNNPTKSYPKGVAKDDLNKTVVRTIKVTTPDGKTTTTRQTVDLNRVAVVDEVTGQVTYSKWSLGELDRYDVPVVDGYIPSQDRVNMEVANSETKDSVVEITYAPNGQSINITYVDDDKGGATVKSYILAGKTDEVVKTGIEIPDGYEVKGDVPADYTFKAKDNADVTVHLKHKLDKGTETKTVSRIVKITLPDGQTKTIKQEQTLKRSKTTDLVTGDVVYGEWSKAEFDEVVAPEVDGYKPSQAKVEKETVDGNSSDQVVKITYKKVKSDVKVEAKPTVEAKHEAKVQIAPKVEAKASAKPQAKAQPKFVTTELPQTGEKQSKGTTIGAILVGLGSLLGLGALGKRKEK
ncbi:YSIRK signal domain/LPXTG anchor domain surface protein [Ligilactobacillus salivarius]|uniref:Gram-positive cocci surface proteins LPxTG domain-containing protein n=1 Tax=Ligilactobacillus salivarius NIAS840 TaxID=1029822 RepID=F5VG17_9LACO|nr:YSIRK signal domain/LPXTG anchor domain surface protein [Ligilactobacillus salivarius]EGL98306.1 hypothetical protein NIAS840_01737 [Ligilactobacillus salivarius NIAS840]